MIQGGIACPKGWAQGMWGWSMRTEPIKMNGCRSGVTDFGTILPSAPANEQLLVQHVVDPDNTTGNAAVFSDQRRQSEASAAKHRAASAWQLTKAQVSERFVAAGQPTPPNEWWETNPP